MMEDQKSRNASTIWTRTTVLLPVAHNISSWPCGHDMIGKAETLHSKRYGVSLFGEIKKVHETNTNAYHFCYTAGFAGSIASFIISSASSKTCSLSAS